MISVKSSISSLVRIWKNRYPGLGCGSYEFYERCIFHAVKHSCLYNKHSLYNNSWECPWTELWEQKETCYSRTNSRSSQSEKFDNSVSFLFWSAPYLLLSRIRKRSWCLNSCEVAYNNDNNKKQQHVLPFRNVRINRLEVKANNKNR